ncbi:MAG: type II secretion system protein [Betaproteobacteria bacterium]|nr:MAG: type II secretion system protein [Betaproteobacteria bacterium]
MRNRGAGFTLIELVVTLSVIAILAALALPRYIALQTQARVAKTQAIFGGIRSASALAHAQVLATNTVTSGATTISMEGVNVTVMNGYPTADANGIITATQMDPTADQITISGGGPGAGDLITININGGTAGSCTVTYQASAAANTSPGIGSSTGGC